MSACYAVIMAGGVGSRFWPESTGAHPKQFLDLTGSGKSLLRQTFERMAVSVPAEQILVVSNRRYRDKILNELPELSEKNLLLEPVMRNTAPAVLLAALRIDALSPGTCFTVLPSDHYIGNEKQFADDMRRAMDFVRKNRVLLTLGIRPETPHTGYGYIRYDKNDTSEFKKVIRFVEKPDYETALSYLRAGDYLWNAGIFVWQTGVILEAFRKHLPGMVKKLQTVDFHSDKVNEQIREIFPQLENISVDYGIMEKASNVRVLPVSFGWNDLGSWDALHKQLAETPERNVAIGTELYVKNAGGNLVKTQGKKVILSGLNDYLVIESGDVLMIIPRREAQEVKQWREKLK